MSNEAPSVGPALSTADTHIFEQEALSSITALSNSQPLSEENIHITYEIERTVREIRDGRWKRVALQFPDHMLSDAPQVAKALSRGLKQARREKLQFRRKSRDEADRQDLTEESSLKQPKTEEPLSSEKEGNVEINRSFDEDPERLFILADTSYGACCVDEIAAQHVNADVVVHYGRSCLSPTERLPVVYVYTKPPLDLEHVCQSLLDTYSDLSQKKIILMADVPYTSYLNDLSDLVKRKTSKFSIFVTELQHDTTSPLPNRTVPLSVTSGDETLESYDIFHISEPPSSLLLTLFSVVNSVQIYPTSSPNSPPTTNSEATFTRALLKRRYALLTRVSTASVIGILVNTLSVKSYNDIVKHLQRIISNSGKKYYKVVVGKVNPAKLANFDEIGGWVVVGCWESSVFDSNDFFKPIITPWELEMALKDDRDRVWTGEWRSDFKSILDATKTTSETEAAVYEKEDSHDQLYRNSSSATTPNTDLTSASNQDAYSDSEPESAPPDFDLRTGRYVATTISRPMNPGRPEKMDDGIQNELMSTKEPVRALVERTKKNDLAAIGKNTSPAAEFFKAQRSWQGLGSDFKVEYSDDGSVKPTEGASVEQGWKGIARGYLNPDADGDGEYLKR